MRILIATVVIFASVLSTAVLSACSSSETVDTPAITGTKTSAPPSKSSSATIGWVTVSSTPATPVIPTVEADPFRIAESTYQLKEVGEPWWTFEYSFKVQNNTNYSLEINLIIQFLDSDCVDIATQHQAGVIIQPLELKTVTGVMKVDATLAWDMAQISVGYY